MLARLIEFSLAQRLLIAALTLALIAAGWQAFSGLPIDAFPDISPTQVKLILKAPGMTPEEVETRVVAPIEMELLGIPRQRVLRSMAKYAIADLTIDFEEGTDVYWARQQVAERFANVGGLLPEGVEGGLAPIATPLSDLFMFTIEGGDLDLAARRRLLDWTLRPMLRTIPGVADVNVLGGRAEAVAVVPRAAAMAQAGLHAADLRDAIEMNHRNDGAGRLIEGEETLILRTEGALRSMDELGDIRLKDARGQSLRLGDVADVRIDSLTRYGAVTRDGVGEAVQGIVIGLRGANARSLIQAVQARLEELKPSLPSGVRIETFYDRSVLVDRAIGTVSRALIEASVLVIIMLLLFLGDVRAALVVTLMMPLAALATFLLMRTFGLSANLMSLGGLAIAIGLLVDGAVVVVENALCRLQPEQASTRIPHLHQIFRATEEVALPVASGVLIIALVFLPLLTLQGLEGKLFTPVALTIVFALAASLLLSLTVVPVLSSFLLKAHQGPEPWLMRRLHALYLPVLDASLAQPRRALAVAVLGFGLAVGAYLATGKTFLPTLDEGDVLVQLEKLPSITLEASQELDLSVQRALLERIPDIEHVVARVGSDELGFDPMSLNQTDMFLKLKPREQWQAPDKSALIESIRQVLDQFPGVSYGFTQPIEMRVSEMLTGTRGDVAVKIFGPDLRQLGSLAQELAQILRGVPGSEDVFLVANEGVQYLSAEIDRAGASSEGLSVLAIQDELRSRLEGVPAGVMIDAGRRVPLIVRSNEQVRSDVNGFLDGVMTLDDGGQIPLRRVVQFQRVDGPVKIDRENGSRFAVIQSGVSGRDLVGFVADAQQQVATRMQLPPGYRVVWGGQFENQQRAAARLALVVPVALAGIFLILFSTFGALRPALLILANVPFALVGGLMALWLTGEYLSVPASVGFIALLGIAVLNGLVMVAYFSQLRATGLSLHRAVREGAIRRLRPVMMTASITALGLVPLLFATGPGSEIQRPLAIVVIGGLLSATPLTLLLLPLLFRRYGEPT
ncbi:MAG: efflux RND transporter permease subunit [Rhodanobacteraceae bacterium]|nr:efflux RND transporter permease subunit [Rhodanobacteraceae bacterium]